jgi:DNA-binding transcriptional ArsR family regulator
MLGSLTVDGQERFVYRQSMNAEHYADAEISRIAGAIGEPARARMLYCLMDGHARTSTELSVVAEVSPSTASVHLNRLKIERLVKVQVQGKHRFYSLEGPEVASALEGLSVLAGGSRKKFVEHAEPVACCANLLRSHGRGSGRVAARSI